MEKYTILNKIMSSHFKYEFIDGFLKYDNKSFIEQRLFSFLKIVNIISPENRIVTIKLVKEIFNIELKFAIELLDIFVDNMYLTSTDRPFSKYFIAQYGKSYINLYSKYINTTIDGRIAKILLTPREEDEDCKFKITRDEILFISEGEEIE